MIIRVRLPAASIKWTHQWLKLTHTPAKLTLSVAVVVSKYSKQSIVTWIRAKQRLSHVYDERSLCIFLNVFSIAGSLGMTEENTFGWGSSNRPDSRPTGDLALVPDAEENYGWLYKLLFPVPVTLKLCGYNRGSKIAVTRYRWRVVCLFMSDLLLLLLLLPEVVI